MTRRRSLFSAVVALLFGRSPAAVLWRVVSVGGYAVERVLFGTRPHIGKKSREIVEPFGAHKNPPPAVVAGPDVFRVVATLFRAHPRFVFWRFMQPVFCRGFLTCGHTLLPPEAPAGFSAFSGSQVAAGYYGMTPAFACAKPHDAGFLVGHTLDDGEASEAFIGQIEKEVCTHG